MSLPPLVSDLTFLPYITAYIDLLGLSNRLAALDALRRRDLSRDEQRGLAQEAIRPIELIRNTFRDFYAEFSKEEEAVRTLSLEVQQKIKDEVLVNTTIVQSFGDAVAISVPLRSDLPVATWRGLYAMFASLAVSQFSLLATKQLTRGGIAVGFGVEAYPSEIIGASLARAVHLEKVAVNPRILVDAPVMQFLEATIAGGGLIGELAEQTMVHVSHDKDSQAMIDYLCPSVQNSLRNHSGERYLAALAEIKEFARLGCHEGDEHHRTKYVWLVEYVAGRLEQ